MTDITELREYAREMSNADYEAQRESFVYGNTHIENSHVTREMVAAVARELAAEDGER